MATLIGVLVLLGGLAWYFISVGKKLEKSGGLKTALGIHGKINKVRQQLRKEKEEELEKLDPNNPRDFFNDPH